MTHIRQYIVICYTYAYTRALYTCIIHPHKLRIYDNQVVICLQTLHACYPRLETAKDLEDNTVCDVLYMSYDTFPILVYIACGLAQQTHH